METTQHLAPAGTAPAPTVDELLPDELHLPFSLLVGDLTDIEGQVSDLPEVMAMCIEQISLQLPVELLVEMAPDGRLQVLGSPPTQRTETTILPVFHRLVMRVVRDGSDDG
jgi:hypothetical protein